MSLGQPLGSAPLGGWGAGAPSKWLSFSRTGRNMRPNEPAHNERRLGAPHGCPKRFGTYLTHP